MTNLIGKNLGNYRITGLLNTGGMGEVYQGSTTQMPEIQVALKVINPAWITQPEGRAHFLHEVESLDKLDHPNIVRLRDCGADPATGLLYLVMDLISGGSLRGLIADHRQRGIAVPLDLALALAHQATEGLAYAHRQGILHQDIKPENLLLQPVTGTDTASPYILKIADFGLTRLRQGIVGSPFQPSSGALWVTLTYAAPEQLQGLTVDERSDIYALGVVLYELLSGQPPFSIDVGDVTAASEYHSNMLPVLPRTYRPDLPDEVEALIMRCLAKDPAQRFATASEIGAALQRSMLPGTPPPQRPQWAKPGVIQPHDLPSGTHTTPSSRSEQPLSAHAIVPPTLCIRDRAGQQRMVPLPGVVSVVGRNADCDIVLTSPRVSRNHLRLEWDGTQVFVTDLDSANGTRLDGQDVPPNQRTLLPPEARVQAGHDTFWWQQPGDMPQSLTVAIDPCEAHLIHEAVAPAVDSEQDTAQSMPGQGT
jgi:serine/threonine protein kinase